MQELYFDTWSLGTSVSVTRRCLNSVASSDPCHCCDTCLSCSGAHGLLRDIHICGLFITEI